MAPTPDPSQNQNAVKVELIQGHVETAIIFARDWAMLLRSDCCCGVSRTSLSIATTNQIANSLVMVTLRQSASRTLTIKAALKIMFRRSPAAFQLPFQDSSLHPQ